MSKDIPFYRYRYSERTWSLPEGQNSVLFSSHSGEEARFLLQIGNQWRGEYAGHLFMVS